jgi:hypothetical protein
MDWKKNKAALLNEGGQVQGIYRHAALIKEAYESGASVDFVGDLGWKHLRPPPAWFLMASYRVNPAWLDAKIAEQKAAEKTAEDLEDLPVVTDGDGVYMVANESEDPVYYLSHTEKHFRFAGIVSHDGDLYRDWASYAEENGLPVRDKDQKVIGYRVPVPKAVRLWKETAK